MSNLVDRYVYIMHDVIKSNGYIIKLKKDTIRTNILHPLSNNSFKIFLYRRKKLATKNIHKTSSSLPSQFPFFTIFFPSQILRTLLPFVLKNLEQCLRNREIIRLQSRSCWKWLVRGENVTRGNASIIWILIEL